MKRLLFKPLNNTTCDIHILHSIVTMNSWRKAKFLKAIDKQLKHSWNFVTIAALEVYDGSAEAIYTPMYYKLPWNQFLIYIYVP